MDNKLSGVLAATLALTMSLQTGAIASSSSKTPVVSSQEVANKELDKIAAGNAAVLTKSLETTIVKDAVMDNCKLIYSDQ